jgi:hypothetical protein
MAFRSKLRSVLSSKLAELTTLRTSTSPKASEDQDVDEVVPEVLSLNKLKLGIREDWQHACEAYAALHDGGQLDEELIVGYVEGVVREYILDMAVSPLSVAP